MGGSDAPEEQGPTAEEKELARQGVEKYNRYATQYAPLEDAMVADISRPVTNLTAGRTNADIMQEASRTATQAMGSDNISQGLASLNGLRQGLASAGSANATNAVVTNQTTQDERAMGAIETGLGMARTQQQSLTQLGQQSNQQALNALSNETMLSGVKANNQATLLGSLAGAGVNGYNRYQGQQRLDQMFRTDALNDFRDYGG